MHTVGEVLVLGVVAPVGERKDGKRRQVDVGRISDLGRRFTSGIVLRRGPGPKRPPPGRRDGDASKQPEHTRGPALASRLGHDRIEIRRGRGIGTSHSLGSDLERPGERQGNRKSGQDQKSDRLENARRQIEALGNHVRYLKYYEGASTVDRGDAEHPPPLQLCKEPLVSRVS